MATPRATVLAVIWASNDVWLSLAGTLAWYGWRGARTVVVMVGGVQDATVRERVKWSMSLLQVEQHFHWESLSDESLLVERLTRTLRAFHPHAILCTPMTLSLTQHAWDNAINPSVSMPGVAVVNPDLSRLWMSGGTCATLNVSAARGVKHALRVLYQNNPTASFPLPPALATETFASVAGVPIRERQSVDLLDGFAQVGLRHPLFFEERRGFSTPISTHQGADPQ